MQIKLRTTLSLLNNLPKRNSKSFLKGSIRQIGPDSSDLQITNVGKGAAEEITVNFKTVEFENSQRTSQPNELQRFFIPAGAGLDTV